MPGARLPLRPGQSTPEALVIGPDASTPPGPPARRPGSDGPSPSRPCADQASADPPAADQASADPPGPGEPDLVVESHDPSGLGLAQTVARSLGVRRPGPGRRSGRRAPGVRRVGSGPQVSGSHPDDRDPQRLGAAMDRLVESKGWTTEVDVRGMLARWPALVGPVNAAHSHPETYTDTVLTVRTDSTAWATQLRLLAPQLVAMLNAALGDGTVTRVNVKGPDAPSWKKGRLSVRDGRGPRDTYG